MSNFLIGALLCLGSVAVLIMTAPVQRPDHAVDLEAPANEADIAVVDTVENAVDDAIDDPVEEPGEDAASADQSGETAPDLAPAAPNRVEARVDDAIDLAEAVEDALPAEIVLDDESATLVFRETPWLASDIHTAGGQSEQGPDIVLDLPGGLELPLDASQLTAGHPITLPPESLDALERTNYRLQLRTERLAIPIRAAAPPTTNLVWQVVAGPHQITAGRFRVPVRVYARERIGDTLRAATAPATTRFLLEAPGAVADPDEVTIEEGEARSERAFVVLRPEQTVSLVATAPGDGREPARLELSWPRHGPQDLTLEVKPAVLDGYATPASVTRFNVRLLVDGRPTPWPTSPSVDAPPTLHLEPLPVDLTGDAATIDVWAGDGVDGEIVLELPDLGLRETISVRVSSPWKYLVIAALLGIVGLIVAKRTTLFAGRQRLEIACEMLSALTGGAFLYFSYLAGWIPLDMDLLGEPQAGAIGILGGYLGDGVFLLVARILRLVPR
ncbi:MAG: hypothetical protein AAGC60_29975 [Acidobacteriota bacterium]